MRDAMAVGLSATSAGTLYTTSVRATSQEVYNPRGQAPLPLHRPTLLPHAFFLPVLLPEPPSSAMSNAFNYNKVLVLGATSGIGRSGNSLQSGSC